jgi:hypothetical protein
VLNRSDRALETEVHAPSAAGGRLRRIRPAALPTADRMPVSRDEPAVYDDGCVRLRMDAFELDVLRLAPRSPEQGGARDAG